MMDVIFLRLFGETYPIKEELKSDGFRWNPDSKCWYKRFSTREVEYARNLGEAFETTDGVWYDLAY